MFVLDLQKKLNVQRTSLFDGATVRCNKEMYLSRLKMIEKFRSFYMKFGFKMNCKTHGPTYGLFKNEKLLENFLKKLVNDIKKLKISKITNDLNKIINLLTLVIKNNDYQNFEIQLW